MTEHRGPSHARSSRSVGETEILECCRKFVDARGSWIRAALALAVIQLSTVTIGVHIAVACQSPEAVVARAGETWSGRVVSISDGDTLDVMRNGRRVRVRLAGIDAPEYGQPWNRRARARLSELVMRSVVSVKVLDVDRYGRKVVDVTIADGRRASDVLVSEGLAWFYDVYSDDARLEQLVNEARAARRGLWTDPNPTPPWEWRVRHPRVRR